MLIQVRRPFIRPPGNVTYRVNRNHRLADGVRAVVLFGPPYGLGRELLTGSPIIEKSGTPTFQTSMDGMGAYLTGNAALTTADASPLWVVTDECSIGWRGRSGSTSQMLWMLWSGTTATTQNMPYGLKQASYILEWHRYNATAYPGGYRAWSSPSPGGAGGYLYDAPITWSVSQGADISVAPVFWFAAKAVAGSPTNLSGGTGSGPSAGGPNPLQFGWQATAASSNVQTINIIVIAAREWSAVDHLAFQTDPYGILEEVPRLIWAKTPAAGGAITGDLAATIADVTASSSGTLDLNAEASPTIAAVALSAAGALAIAGASSPTIAAITLSASGALPIAAALASTISPVTLAAAGTLPLAGAAAITLGAVTLTSAGTLPIVGALAVTLDAVTLSAAGALDSPDPIAGELTVTLGAVALSAAGTLALSGEVAATVGAVTLLGEAALPATGALSVTIGDVTLFAYGAAAGLTAPAARTYTWRDTPRRATWQTGPRVAAWLDRPRRVDWRDSEMPSTVFQLRPQHVDDELDHGFVFTAFGSGDDVASYTVTVPGEITQTASMSAQTVTVRIQGSAGTHRIVVHAVADSGQEATIEADIVISDPS